MSTDRDLLAAAVAETGVRNVGVYHLADALLPVVDRIAERRATERAAAELRAAANDLATLPGNPYPLVVAEFLNGRANHLDPS